MPFYRHYKLFVKHYQDRLVTEVRHVLVPCLLPSCLRVIVTVWQWAFPLLLSVSDPMVTFDTCNSLPIILSDSQLRLAHIDRGNDFIFDL